LRHWVQTDGLQVLSLRAQAGRVRPSQLGAWYPAGS
jgi:hypothetical protein